MSTALFGCTPKASVITEDVWVASPASADTADVCADIGATRACWSAARDSVARVPRPTPTSLDAWRCKGQGATRACRRRLGAMPGFACDAGICVMDRPEAPDDGEWECFERNGAVVCRGGERAAGVVGDRRDEAWFCGELRTTDAGGGSPQRICIDYAPLAPPETGRVCRYETSPSRGRRVCDRRTESKIGAECNEDTQCPAGASCTAGACLPRRPPRPECWVDGDCGPGERCLFASCVAAP